MRVFFRKLRNLSFFIQYYCLVSETPCAKLCATFNLLKTLQCEVFTSIIFTCDQVFGKSSLQVQWTATIRQKIIAVLVSFCTVWFALMPSHPISFYQNLAIHGKTFLWFGKNCAPSIMLHHPTKTFTRIYSWHFVPVLIQLVCAWLKILRTTFQHSEI